MDDLSDSTGLEYDSFSGDETGLPKVEMRKIGIDVFRKLI